MTTVLCLNQPERIAVYSLPPRLAVFAAHQQALKKGNAWQYAQDIERTPPKRTRCGWLMGDFWAQDKHLPDWLCSTYEKSP